LQSCGACDASLATVNDNTIIIPGHGKTVSNKAAELRDMLTAIRDNVAKLKKLERRAMSLSPSNKVCLRREVGSIRYRFRLLHATGL
jgi:hypothetical protein